MRLPRTTGVASGVLVVVLGVWGALIPFVGPYFHYAFGNYDAWNFTASRFWLDVLPGVLAVIGGVLLLTGTRRSTGILGGSLAIAGGAWYAIGPSVSLLWHGAGSPIGVATGGATRRMLEQLGYFYGIGVAIAALAAFAMGRYVSRPRVAEEPFVAAGAVAGEVADHRRRRAADE
ncbi:MAG TPA: hypothetical protein VHR88_10040 [Solirubrobacteraceae bacterium]|jgi:hypothetical protein|nr:hypothetical protein [Solirubrobacteraceae bacterium]